MDPYVTRNPNELQVSDLVQDDLFIRWVRSGDPEADAFWTSWLVNHPEMEERIEAARTLVLALQFDEEKIPAHQVQAEWNRLYSALSDDHGKIADRKNWFLRKTTLSIAAVFTLIVASLVYFLIDKYNHQEIQYVTRTTSKGQKLSITLPDGTKIKLNSDSEIQYPIEFTDDNREVILKGEAFFDVTHNGRVPFKVHSAGVTVVVTGTSFNVSAYPENTDVKIALEKGEVKIKLTSETASEGDIVLKPNEMIEINKSSYSHEVLVFDPLEMTSWKDGCLYLGRADFKETVLKLERWFGVKFEMDTQFQSNPNWRFIGKFQDKPLTYILETISYPDLFRYKIDAQKVFIY